MCIDKSTALHRNPLLWLLLCLWAPAPTAADLVLYDEDAATQLRQLDHCAEAPEAAFEGAMGLRMEPTYWHSPFMRIPQRTDFRSHDRLEFFIRSSDRPMEQRLTAWDYAMGAKLDLAPYVEGGVIDEQWRRVSIPVDDMVSDDFAMDSVFVLMFDKMSTPRPFYIDNLTLRKITGPRVTGHHLRSNRVLTITADDFDREASANPSAYTIRSLRDSNYRRGTPPLETGTDRQAIGVSVGGEADVESRLHLLLPYPLKPYRLYEVSLTGMVSDNGIPAEQTKIQVTFDPQAVSSSIKVNQVGYALGRAKIAYVGNWMGDLGPMPVEDREFTLVQADTGKIVHIGDLSPRAMDDPQSGEDVYEADFSDFFIPGRYRIEVEGIGSSHPFEIATNVYDPVYRTVMRFFYHKRDIILVAPYADPGFERAGIDPSLNGVFHPVVADYPLSAGEVPFAKKTIVKGWYDAGDYGQYMHNAAPVWFAFGAALDLAPPGHFADGELGVPESGNGIPDLIDELGWGMDWALSMQDPGDGGVYWRLSSGGWDMGMPSEISQPRFIYEKTTRATAQFAAMGAIYARLIEPYDAPRAAAVLDAAEDAWDYLQCHPIWPAEGSYYRNPVEYPGGGEYSSNTSKPDMLWAAAELNRATADPTYQDAYRDLVPEARFDITGAPLSTRAFWAMAMSLHENRDPILVENARRAIMRAADIRLKRSLEHPYRSPKHPHIPYTGWHSFSGSVMTALALFQAYHLSGADAYADLAWIMPNITLGANPLSRSFITGVGANPTRDPMDRISLADGTPEAVRGMPIPGPTWHLPGSREPYISLNNAYYPPEQPETEGDYANAYPVLRRYADAHDLIPMNEGTVAEAALTAAAFGLLRDCSAPPVAAARLLDWVPGESKRAWVLHLTDIALDEVHLLSPARITAFGASVGHAGVDSLQALSGEQVAAIDAPGIPYWVQKLTLEQRGALTPEQIAAFEHWSLFTNLPPSQVSHIPPAKIPGIGIEFNNTSREWKAALDTDQIAAMTPDQSAIMAKAGF